ncbi:MAG: bifunctional 4-hydroxy-2-oxoglutarate aldolase/2-dehydro-3-deoxy-phosphogluconate aldolase [Cryobacterium sp.]|nr:bifunctional 4-hydroxy-2-oxoglutarate aldolase/2-dehydro-3-deoxy-phosphogluconate aldolase [Cryobacterium sp.]
MTVKISSEWFDENFSGQRVMAIARNLGVEKTIQFAEAVWATGIQAFEVTLQNEEDIRSLREIVKLASPNGYLVGAGTVTSRADVEAAKEAGAAFTISPGFDPEIVSASLEAGLPSLPGVATATEVQRARSLGLTWLKAFPAIHLGPEWFHAIAGPFPEVRFSASGGLNAENARTFLDAGVAAVGIGSSLADPRQLPKVAALLQ